MKPTEKNLCWSPFLEEKARPGGRPGKYDNSISVNKLHDFSDLLEFDKWYNEKYSKLYIESPEPKTTRLLKKRRNKAFLFGLWKLSRNSKTISTSGFVAALPDKSESHQGFKGGKAWKGNAKGAGRPLSYPASIDEELLSWLLIMNDLHLPVSILALQKKAKSLILPQNPCFEASRGWIRQFKERHNLALRKKNIFVSKTPIPT